MTDDPTSIVHATMPLCATLGVRASRFDPDSVVLELDWREGLTTGNGLLHGGAIMAVADSAGAALAYLNLPPEAKGTATIESKTNFLGAVTEGSIVATAKPLHVGSRTIVVETETRNGDRLVAKTTQTQAVLVARA